MKKIHKIDIVEMKDHVKLVEEIIECKKFNSQWWNQQHIVVNYLVFLWVWISEKTDEVEAHELLSAQSAPVFIVFNWEAIFLVES